MRFNGGVIGKSNQPTNRKAGGVWNWQEHQVKRADEEFPRWFAGWDIDTIASQCPVVTGISPSFTAQEGTPTGMFISPDGLILYIIGSGADFVHQYSLSSPWDVASASLVFSLSILGFTPQETASSGVRFKPDGTVMYIVGTALDRVLQYSLSTPWQISTAAFTGEMPTTGESNPNGVYISPDGLKVFVIGTTSDVIRRYDLTTPWNVSTGVFVYASPMLPFASASSGLVFSDDGLRVIVSSNAGSGGDPINTYSMTDPWDVRTVQHDITRTLVASHLSLQPTLSSGELGLQDLFFSPDGLLLFFIGTTHDRVIKVQLSAPWDLKYPGYDGKFADITTISGNLLTTMTSTSGCYLSPDGHHLYIADTSGHFVYQFYMGTPNDIGTLTYTGKRLAANGTVDTSSIWFTPDGLTMYAGTPITGGLTFVKRNLSVPWDITTSTSSTTFSDTTAGSAISQVFVTQDGTRAYFPGNSSRIHQYSLTTPYALETLVKIQTVSLVGSIPSSILVSVAVSPDGSKMFIAEDGPVSTNADHKLFQLDLTTAWNVSSWAYSSAYDLSNLLLALPIGSSGSGTACFGVFTADGTKFLIGTSLELLYELNLG